MSKAEVGNNDLILLEYQHCEITLILLWRCEAKNLIVSQVQFLDISKNYNNLLENCCKIVISMYADLLILDSQ